jgi:hypothetical protein
MKSPLKNTELVKKRNVVTKKFSAKYKKGFREGFNNPNQYKKIDLSHPKADNDYVRGIISGVLVKLNNSGKFIWNETDLKRYLK